MRSKIVGAFVALLLILTGALSASEPARGAEPPPSVPPAVVQVDPPLSPGYDCPFVNGTHYDAICGYAGTNFTGFLDFWYPSHPRNTCVKFESSPTATADSIYNRTNYVWRLFRTNRCDGSHMIINPYTYKAYMPAGWDNIAGLSRTSTTG